MNRNSLCSDIFSPIRYDTSFAGDLNKDENSGTSEVLKAPSITVTKASSERTLNVFETPRVVKKAEKKEKEHMRATYQRNSKLSPVDKSDSSRYSLTTSYDSVFARTCDDISLTTDINAIPGFIVEEFKEESNKSTFKTVESRKPSKSRNVELALKSNSNSSTNQARKRSKPIVSHYVTVRNGGSKRSSEKKTVSDILSNTIYKGTDNSKMHSHVLSPNLPAVDESIALTGVPTISPSNKISSPNGDSSSRLNLDLRTKPGVNQRTKIDLNIKGNVEFMDTDAIAAMKREEKNKEQEILPPADAVMKNESNDDDATETLANPSNQIQANLIEKLITDSISFEFDAIRQQLYLQHVSSSMALNRKMDEMEERNAMLTEKFCKMIEELSLQNRELRKIIDIQAEASSHNF